MRKIVVVGISLILIFLSYVFYTHYQHEERVRTALAYGHLAQLPRTITYVEADTEGGMFSRTFWLTFQTSDAEINTWLKESPKLVKIPTTQLLGNNPKWFIPKTIPQQQREIFEFTSAKENTRAMVWVDRGSKTVYIKTSHG